MLILPTEKCIETWQEPFYALLFFISAYYEREQRVWEGIRPLALKIQLCPDVQARQWVLTAYNL